METPFASRKPFVFLLLTVLIILATQETGHGQNLDIGQPRAVRMIYFLPSDHTFRPNVVQRMTDRIREVQAVYAEQMQAHGYRNKTFSIETNARGKPVVHRVDGHHPSSYYENDKSLGDTVIQDLEKGPFDPNLNISLIYIGIDALLQGNGEPVGGVGEALSKSGGYALVTSEFMGPKERSFYLVAHELGHAFGLRHDFSNEGNIVGGGSSYLSACNAEFLSVHPYFNPKIPLIEETSPSTIELISPRRYMAGANSVSIRLKVSDSDGLHQVLLYVPGWGQELKACRGLQGKRNAIVEFDYNLLSTNSLGTSAGNSPNFTARTVDTHGNRSDPFFIVLAETSPHHIATLEGHTGRVRTVAFSPDGTILASSAGSGEKGAAIKFWDIAAKKNIATLEGVQASTVAFSPDGTILASAGNHIELWDVATRTNIAGLYGHTGWVMAAAFSPDGRTLASASWDQTVKLWDVATRRNIATLKGHTDIVHSVAFSPDGTILASGAYDTTVKLWNIATGTNIATLSHEFFVKPVAFSPDGTILASGNLAEVDLWNVKTKENLATLEHRSGVEDLVFSPDGATLASAAGGRVTLWNVGTRTSIATFPHTGRVSSVMFSPDGATLAAATSDSKVELWQVSEIDMSRPTIDVPPPTDVPRPTPPGIKVMDIDPTQRPPLYWVGGTTGTLHRLISDTVENLASNVKNVTGLAVDAAGGKLYWTEKTGARTGRIQRANLDGNPNRQLVKNLTSVPLNIALDAANGKIYLANAWGKVQRLNVDGSNFQPNLITGLETPRHLALDVSGDKVYWTEMTDGSGRIRRANRNGSSVQNIITGLAEPMSLAITHRKIYWIERTTRNTTKLQRANLNGTNRELLETLPSALTSIAVDTVRNALYLTSPSGEIHRRNLDGSGYQPVVTGLVSPSGIVLGIPATVSVPPDTPVPPETPVVDAAADVNRDKKVNKTDLLLVVTALGETSPANPKFDVNDDSTVNIADVLLVIEALDDPVAAAAPSLGEIGTALDPTLLTTQLDILRAESDGSMKYAQAIAFFQGLLASLRPTETQLLANYPNPFNPETWIPYQLAKDSDVKISIYDAKGVLVHTLALGHQSAGFYTDKSRAAFWNGRNTFGERVASGVYFYQLQVGNVSSLRKMTILK